MDATKLLTILILSATLGLRAHAETALDALRLLPKGEAKKLARIEAREGAPEPERWHLLTYDEQSETGLREYVVAAGEVVASRQLSQFAESVQSEEVFGGEAVKFDSDRAAQVAQLYAAANQAAVATIHYQLRKAGSDAVPLWTLICLDPAGRELGRIVVSATKGSVIAHDGFPVDPPPSALAAPALTSRPKPKKKAPATPPAEAQPGAPVEPPPAVAERPGFFDRVRGSIQKVLPGKKSEDR